jgi:hypothetical protein
MREREGKDRRYSARAPDNGGPHAHAPRPPHPPTRHRITLPHPARPHAAPRARSSSSAVRARARSAAAAAGRTRSPRGGPSPRWEKEGREVEPWKEMARDRLHAAGSPRGPRTYSLQPGPAAGGGRGGGANGESGPWARRQRRARGGRAS